MKKEPLLTVLRGTVEALRVLINNHETLRLQVEKAGLKPDYDSWPVDCCEVLCQVAAHLKHFEAEAEIKIAFREFL